MQYFGESITPANSRMNIHLKGKKSDYEYSMNHYKNVSRVASCSIQIRKMVEQAADVFINVHREFSVQTFCLLREDYYMKKLRTIYSDGLNETAKISNLEQARGKFFPSLLKFGNRRENLGKIQVNELNKIYTTETLLVHKATFPRNSSKNFCKSLKKNRKERSNKVSIKCN